MKFILQYGLLIIGIALLIIGYSEDSFVVVLGFLISLPGLLIASRSSMLGYGKDMQLLNGIGSTLYGNSDFDPIDGTHISTKFFVFLWLPIYPIMSYRVRQKETTQKFFGVNTQYEMKPVSLNTIQIAKIYLSTWGIIGIIIALIILL